jgi:two-component system sensor histidine kinase DegS
MRLALYRSAQEALNNAVKHSQATSLSVVLDFQSANEIVLMVEDNGQGADQMEGGFGLIGIKERVQLLNGEVKFTSARGQGFKVEIRLPG